MDKEFEEEKRQKLVKIILNHPDVLAVHDLRTRISGMRHFIQFHLEMDGEMTLNQAHHIADEVEASLSSVFPDVEILIHQDPAGAEKVSEQEERIISE